MQIETSDKIVIDSGSFITLGRENNKLYFEYQGEKFQFELSFLIDISKGIQVDYSPNDTKDTLIMKFYNFEDNMGVTLISPIEIAESKGKKMYANFTIRNLNLNNKQVMYTFYINK